MYIESGILGVVVGAAGTVLGGIIAMLIGGRVKEPRPFLAFAGGMMIAVVFFDMLFESAQVGSVWTMCGGAAAGGAFFALVFAARLTRGDAFASRHGHPRAGWVSRCTTCRRASPSARRSWKTSASRSRCRC